MPPTGYPSVALIEELKYFQPRHRETNFLSEGVRLGLDKEIRLDGTYLAYVPYIELLGLTISATLCYIGD